MTAPHPHPESREARVERLLRKLAVPTIYRDARVADIEPFGTPANVAKRKRVKGLVGRYLALWGDRENPDIAFPHIVIFRGEFGSTKTFAMYAIAKHVVETFAHDVLVLPLADVIRDLRRPWRRDYTGPDESQLLEKYRRVELLCLDEVSRHALYGEPAQHLYDLVAHREQWLRPTILATNEHGSSVDDIIGPALTSRAAGHGGLWDFGDEDFRPLLLERRRERAAFVRTNGHTS